MIKYYLSYSIYINKIIFIHKLCLLLSKEKNKKKIKKNLLLPLSIHFHPPPFFISLIFP